MLLLRVRLRSAVNAIRFARPGQRWLGAALSGGALVLFFLLLFLFGAFLAAARTAGPSALLSLIDRTLLFSWLFLLASSVPFVSQALLSPGDLPLLLATPARPAAVVSARLLDAVVASLAQFLVIGVPLLVASAWALDLPYWGWAVFVLIVVPFLLLPPLLVAASLLLLARLVGPRRVRLAVVLVSALLAVGMCLLMVDEAARQTGAALRLTEDRLAGGSAPTLRWLPPNWAGEALRALGEREPVHTLFPLALLLLATAGCAVVAVSLGHGVLLNLELLEGEGASIRTEQSNLLDNLLGLLPFSAPARALIVKDLRYIARDLVLLSQIGIPLILYLVPFIIAGQMQAYGARPQELFALSAGVVATIGFMETSILSLSSVGLEGRAFWTVLHAPLSAGQFVRAKFIAAFAVSTGLCLPLLVVSCSLFRVPPTWLTTGIGLLLIACAALCGLGVGIAGLFPRFVYDNPAHRASLSALIWGFVGATIYVVVSVLMLAGGAVAVFHWPEHRVLLLGGMTGLFLLFSLLTAVVPLLLACRRLDAYAWEEV